MFCEVIDALVVAMDELKKNTEYEFFTLVFKMEIKANGFMF